MGAICNPLNNKKYIFKEMKGKVSPRKVIKSITGMIFMPGPLQ